MRISKRKPAWNKGIYKKIDLKKCKKLYLQGFSLIKIAKIFDVNRETIRRRLLIIGVKCRSPKIRHIGNGNPNWKGGITKRKDGYEFTYSPYHPFCLNKKYILTHRLIMEKYLKRFLTPKEIVHHIDENPSNNSLCNLKLLTRKEHNKIHHKGGNLQNSGL